jgi:hypothetical protein
MNFSVKKLIPVIAISMATFLVGCGGDYPDKGKIDLSEIQKQVKVIAVEGNVYGVKIGGLERIAAYGVDKSMLSDYDGIVFEALKQGTPIPDLTLTYPPAATAVLNAATALLNDYPEGVKAQAQEQLKKDTKRFQLTQPTTSYVPAYRDAMTGDILSYIEQSVALELDGENVVFDGLDDGYEALVVFAEITAEDGQGRSSVKTIELVELNPEVMKGVSEIVIPYTKKGVRDGMKNKELVMEDGRILRNIIRRFQILMENR